MTQLVHNLIVFNRRIVVDESTVVLKGEKLKNPDSLIQALISKGKMLKLYHPKLVDHHRYNFRTAFVKALIQKFQQQSND